MPGLLNIVARYHYAVSDEAAGLITSMGAPSDLGSDDLPLFIGDEYNSFYLGTNLHLYRDQIILMGGLEYGLLSDEMWAGFDSEAMIWHAGARVSF